MNENVQTLNRRYYLLLITPFEFSFERITNRSQSSDHDLYDSDSKLFAKIKTRKFTGSKIIVRINSVIYEVLKIITLVDFHIYIYSS